MPGFGVVEPQTAGSTIASQSSCCCWHRSGALYAFSRPLTIVSPVVPVCTTVLLIALRVPYGVPPHFEVELCPVLLRLWYTKARRQQSCWLVCVSMCHWRALPVDGEGLQVETACKLHPSTVHACTQSYAEFCTTFPCMLACSGQLLYPYHSAAGAVVC